MKDLEQIVKQLNDTNLMPYQIEDIETMVNSNNQNALTLAVSLGLDKAVSKLLKPIYRSTETEKFIPGVMERQAEVDGNGISTIEQQPKMITKAETKAYYLDLFQKDNFGKSAFDYACLKADKSLMTKIYLESNDSRLYAVKFKRADDIIDVLSYFISELCRATKYNQPTESIVNIIEELSTVKPLVKGLSKSSFTAFTSLMWSETSFPTKYVNILKNMSKDVSQEALNLCFNQSITTSQNKNLSSVIGIVQPQLLKNGASITQEQIDMLRGKVESAVEEKNGHNLQNLFDDNYTIDPNDFKTIVGKPKQVIETYFKKNYKDVFKEYIDKGLVDYDSLVKASQCKYDLDVKSKSIQETRIGLLLQLGANISMTNELGESLFSQLDEKQIVDVFQGENISLTDQDVLAISAHSFGDLGFPFEMVDKIYKEVIKHQVQGNIEEYKNRMERAKIQLDLDNIHQFYGVEEFYSYDLMNNLNAQLKNRLEAEKQRLITMQQQNPTLGVESIPLPTETKKPKL